MAEPSVSPDDLSRCDDVLDIGSIQEAGRRAMLEPIILAASRPPALTGRGVEDDERDAEPHGRQRETLAVDPRPEELRKEEEGRRGAVQVPKQLP